MLARKAEQRRVLIIVLGVNAVMFAAELAVGILANSAALIADSADMFGDAFVYALSLYALDRSARWKAGAALAKGLFILLFGLAVLIEIVARISSGAPPLSGPMLVMSIIALAANLYCFRLLWQFRHQDINMASTFECSQNDIVANVGVVIAAVAVWYLQSPWPDILVAAIIAFVFLRSAVRVLRSAWPEFREASA
ncbi:MAG: cation diffusion facilitator family transporter [Parasphingopyxis sp.]